MDFGLGQTLAKGVEIRVVGVQCRLDFEIVRHTVGKTQRGQSGDVIIAGGADIAPTAEAF